MVRAFWKKRARIVSIAFMLALFAVFLASCQPAMSSRLLANLKETVSDELQTIAPALVFQSYVGSDLPKDEHAGIEFAHAQSPVIQETSAATVGIALSEASLDSAAGALNSSNATGSWQAAQTSSVSPSGEVSSSFANDSATNLPSWTPPEPSHIGAIGGGGSNNNPGGAPFEGFDFSTVPVADASAPVAVVTPPSDPVPASVNEGPWTPPDGLGDETISILQPPPNETPLVPPFMDDMAPPPVSIVDDINGDPVDMGGDGDLIHTLDPPPVVFEDLADLPITAPWIAIEEEEPSEPDVDDNHRSAPEPATLVQVLVGLGALLAANRRRRRSLADPSAE